MIKSAANEASRKTKIQESMQGGLAVPRLLHAQALSVTPLDYWILVFLKAALAADLIMAWKYSFSAALKTLPEGCASIADLITAAPQVKVYTNIIFCKGPCRDTSSVKLGLLGCLERCKVGLGLLLSLAGIGQACLELLAPPEDPCIKNVFDDFLLIFF